MSVKFTLPSKPAPPPAGVLKKPPVLARSAVGAALLIGLQFSSRALSFIVNQVLLRYLSLNSSEYPHNSNYIPSQSYSLQERASASRSSDKRILQMTSPMESGKQPPKVTWMEDSCWTKSSHCEPCLYLDQSRRCLCLWVCMALSSHHAHPGSHRPGNAISS